MARECEVCGKAETYSVDLGGFKPRRSLHTHHMYRENEVIETLLCPRCHQLLHKIAAHYGIERLGNFWSAETLERHIKYVN